MTDSKVVRNTEFCEISFWAATRRVGTLRAGFTNRLKPRALKIQGVVQQTVVRIESIAVTVYDQFDKQTFVNDLCF